VTGDSPAVTVSSVAQFGCARLGDTNSVGFDLNQGITEAIDNVSVIRGRHALKAGIDAQFIADRRVRGEQFVYTFPSTAAYLDAKSGVNALGYSTLQQVFGNREASYDSGFYGLFAQDDWQVTPQLKVLYGIRYDVFDISSSCLF